MINCSNPWRNISGPLVNKPREIIARFIRFETEAHQILGSVETSGQSRTMNLRETVGRVSQINQKQRDILQQALRCCELGLFRASHVMAWSALIDRIQEVCSIDSFTKLNAVNPKWNISDLHQLRENFTEFAVIQAAHKAGLLRKTEMKALHGMLSRRNECAHPSDYYPDLNQTLGFISELLARFEKLDRY